MPEADGSEDDVVVRHGEEMRAARVRGLQAVSAYSCSRGSP